MSKNEIDKILAICTQCGKPQGIFKTEEELRLIIAKQDKCKKCGAEFSFLPDGKIWNLRRQLLKNSKTPSDEELDFFWKMNHETIINVSKNLFENEHYAEAVFSALKEVNNRVKTIVKKKIGEELDGAALMFRAFSVDNPIIIIDDLSTETGRSIQDGYMHIFAGAMKGIRNPKAHENITLKKVRAEHFLCLASLLMDKLDEAGY